MDVVPTILALLKTADVAGLMVENRIAFTRLNQPYQIIEHTLYTQPSLDLFPVKQLRQCLKQLALLGSHNGRRAAGGCPW